MSAVVGQGGDAQRSVSHQQNLAWNGSQDLLGLRLFPEFGIPYWNSGIPIPELEVWTSLIEFSGIIHSGIQFGII